MPPCPALFWRDGPAATSEREQKNENKILASTPLTEYDDIGAKSLKVIQNGLTSLRRLK